MITTIHIIAKQTFGSREKDERMRESEREKKGVNNDYNQRNESRLDECVDEIKKQHHITSHIVFVIIITVAIIIITMYIPIYKLLKTSKQASDCRLHSIASQTWVLISVFNLIMISTQPACFLSFGCFLLLLLLLLFGYMLCFVLQLYRYTYKHNKQNSFIAYHYV